jgi:hypothetical protein
MDNVHMRQYLALKGNIKTVSKTIATHHNVLYTAMHVAFLEKDAMQERQERDQLYQEMAMLILEKEGLEDEMDKLKKDANFLKCGIAELGETSVRSGRRSTKEE